MSFKAKDLQFDSSQPAFLRRLRGELTGEDSARHERPISRNKRMKQDDEDDAPTYVLEDTNQSLTKAEYEALVSSKESVENEKSTPDDDAKDQGVEAEVRPKDKIAEVGAIVKKRKAAKVISEEQDDSRRGEDKDVKKIDSKTKRPKKKSKAVKLTFGDEEEK